MVRHREAASLPFTFSAFSRAIVQTSGHRSASCVHPLRTPHADPMFPGSPQDARDWGPPEDAFMVVGRQPGALDGVWGVVEYAPAFALP